MAKRPTSMRVRSPASPTPTPRSPGPASRRTRRRSRAQVHGSASSLAASGRAIANGRDEGFTKLIFDEETHRIIGGGIVGTHAGDLIGEVCPPSKWAPT